MANRKLLLGNEAIALGILEAGCAVATAYPGTPSSEILPAVAAFADELGTKTRVEWGANEAVALEVAAAAAFAGKRSCAVMKQVGLNVAADAFMSISNFESAAGLVLVVVDEPGCHSSQTEQDSRFFAHFAKVPCFDPATAAEAKEMVADAFDLSERHRVITMLRPTGKISHTRQDVPVKPLSDTEKPARFIKDNRFVAHPNKLKTALPMVNARTEAIRAEFASDFGKYNYEVPAKGKARLGIIAGGLPFSVVSDFLRDSGRDDIAVLKIGTPVPLPASLVRDFIDRHDELLILEETYPVIEMQIPDKTKVRGRWNGFVPSTGELLPEIVESLILKALGEEVPSPSANLALAEEEMGIRQRRPSLCAGCPHRASFLAIRKAIPEAINPSDIGCYTLGINQNAVDSILCMGAAVPMSSGFHLAFDADGIEKPVVATIGDATFFHQGIPGLASAVYNRHPFVLAILDNRTTAMTGAQSHPGIGDKLRKDDEGRMVELTKLVEGCGVNHVRTLEAYDVEDNIAAVREAWAHAKEHSEPAVLIFRHPCLLLKEKQEQVPVTVDSGKCVGCKVCIDNFDCPGLVFDETTKKVSVDERLCIKCGVCVSACPTGAIRLMKGDE